jgi:two-component system KDP operon response regulator KdpE
MNKIRVLVVDDEPQIRKLLNIALESSGYDVMLAAFGQEGIRMASQYNPDIILLDIGLPDINGHAVLEELRIWYENPIIMLSVQNSEADIVTALDQGATDYLTKPFRTGELMARIRSSVRKHTLPNGDQRMVFGDLEIDITARTVKKNNEILKLTSTEFNLLTLLATNEGKVLTHQYILKKVWGIGYQKETQYIRVFVAQLRKKIEVNPDQPLHIITESGVGYRFM